MLYLVTKNPRSIDDAPAYGWWAGVVSSADRTNHVRSVRSTEEHYFCSQSENVLAQQLEKLRLRLQAKFI